MPIAADLIVVNGHIWTMDSTRPQAQALAVAQGRIVAIGEDAEIRAFRHAGTRVIDADGASVLPGINESHIHVFGGSVDLDQLSLYQAKGYETLKRLVLDYAARKPRDPLLVANTCD